MLLLLFILLLLGLRLIIFLLLILLFLIIVIYIIVSYVIIYIIMFIIFRRNRIFRHKCMHKQPILTKPWNYDICVQILYNYLR